MAIYSTLPIAGINLTQTFPSTAQVTVGPLGLETFASDGRLYVFGHAASAAALSAGTTVTVNSAFSIAASSAGSYLVGSAGLDASSYGWVSKASV